MRDPRIDTLADMLVTYSIEAKSGQRVLIYGEMGGEPLMAAITRKCLQIGAYPLVIPYTIDYFESVFRYAAPNMFAKIFEPYMQLVKTYDACIRVLGEQNTKEASQFDPDLVSRFYAESGKIFNVMLDRKAKGEMNWVMTLFPTQAYAQDANMSLTDYEDFVYSACLSDLKDPYGYWKKVESRQAKAIEWFKGKENVHITAPGTDLTFSIKGRPFVNCAFYINVPDGEIFTSPIENSLNGIVYYSNPTVYEGFEVDNVHLEFKDGRVVKASADKNEAFLLKKLDTDAGSRSIGEFAIGTNELINRFTGQILLDEKIGGSFHMALGHGYPETLSKNDSTVHWDMVCDLRKDGEMVVDGESFYKNGAFVVDF